MPMVSLRFTVSSRWILIALMLYVPLAAVACLWSWLALGATPFSHPEPWIATPYTTRFALSVLGGVGLGVVVVGLTRVLVRRAAWAQDLHLEFRNLLGPLDRQTITVLALTSGFAEEMFFRGAMLPALGLLLSSVIFGAVHVGPKRLFLPWTLWAFAMGLVFGALFAATGVLWGPIIAHVLINQRNMSFILRHDPLDSYAALRPEIDRV